MNNCIRKVLFSLASALTLTFLTGTMSVSAAEAGSTSYEELYVTGYTVTNETITPGEDFTLTVTLQNFSNKVTASKALLVINNPGGIIPEYGTVSQTYLEDIGPGETAEVSFRYSSDSSIQTSSVDFTVNISTTNFYSTAQLRIPVGRTVDFSTEEVYIPESFVMNRTEYVSAMVENLGSLGVSNVVMVARCDGEDVASSNIGTIAAGTVKTQSLSLTFEDAGQHSLELLLTYTNGDGEAKEYVISTGTIQIQKESDTLEPEKDSISDTEEGQKTDSQNTIDSSNVVLICILGILLIAICSIVLLLIYKRK